MSDFVFDIDDFVLNINPARMPVNAPDGETLLAVLQNCLSPVLSSTGERQHNMPMTASEPVPGIALSPLQS
jgi:hypothetical protein